MNNTAVIDIEGIIGVDERTQFELPGQRISTYAKLKAAVDLLREQKPAEVTVNIRSAGGDVNDALLILDALRSLDAPIVTRCYGYIASAATIIAQAASKGRREISANSLYLIHNSISRAEGNASDLAQTIDLLHKTDLRIAAIYAARSGKTADTFLCLMAENGGNGRWLAPEEARRAGLADKVVGAAAIANDAASMIGKLNLPQIPLNKPQNMSISKKWKELFASLGMAADKDAPDDALAEQAAQTIRNQQEVIDRLRTNPSQDPQVDNLRRQVAALEAQNARLAAKPTFTKPKEDPAVAETKPSDNQSAYAEDARNLK